MKLLIIILLVLNVIMMICIASYCFWFAPLWVKLISYSAVLGDVYLVYLEVKKAPEYD